MAEIHETPATGERRRAREYALQLLFQIDLAPEPLESAVDAFWKGKRVRVSIIEFATHLVRGTALRRDWLDDLLASASHHWRVSRMGAVDRNILRLALYEIIFEKETPPIVVINEAIEIAKKFAADESGPFINGILDAIRVRVEKGEIRPPSEDGGAADEALTPPPRARARA